MFRMLVRLDGYRKTLPNFDDFMTALNLSMEDINWQAVVEYADCSSNEDVRTIYLYDNNFSVIAQLFSDNEKIFSAQKLTVIYDEHLFIINDFDEVVEF